jgi:hypothetical protein
VANFPTTLDTLTNPGAGDSLNSPSHSSQHGTGNDILEALEAKVGTGSSTATSGTVLTGTGAGTSAWSTPLAYPNPDGLTQGGGSSWFCVPGVAPISVVNRASAIDRTNYCPMLVEASRTFDRIAVQVTSAVAGTARLGIYAATSALAPGALVLDAGTVNTGTTGLKAITINQTLSPGVYFLVAHTSSACSLAAVVGSPAGLGTWEDSLDFAEGLTVTQTISALPDPGTAISSVTEGASMFEHFVWLRNT